MTVYAINVYMKITDLICILFCRLKASEGLVKPSDGVFKKFIPEFPSRRLDCRFYI